MAMSRRSCTDGTRTIRSLARSSAMQSFRKSSSLASVTVRRHITLSQLAGFLIVLQCKVMTDRAAGQTSRFVLRNLTDPGAPILHLQHGLTIGSEPTNAVVVVASGVRRVHARVLTGQDD